MAGKIGKVIKQYDASQTFYVKECPDCSADGTVVLDTRLNANGSIRRRRKCPRCGFRFSTIEIDDMLCDITSIEEDMEFLKGENAILRAENAKLKAKLVQISKKIIGE